jgi:hypothetical protein
MTAYIRSTIETFACPRCGTQYRGTKQPWPFVQAGRFDCVVCNAEIHAWSGYYDYTAWKALNDVFGGGSPYLKGRPWRLRDAARRSENTRG